MGRAAIAAVSKARGMELAGAIDSQCIGMDVGELTGMDEALEIPVLNDLTMVLCSIAQTRATGVVVDFSEPSSVHDNVKQDLPSPDAIQIANNISDLGQIYNRQDMDSDNPMICFTNWLASVEKARGQVLGEDGVRVHIMVLPGLASSTSVVLSAPERCPELNARTNSSNTEELDLWPGEVLVGNGQLTYHDNSFFFEEEINGIKSIPRLIIRNTATRKADPRTLRKRHTVLGLAPHIR
ncbi:dihydrodipicolinate reductase-like protein CRR1, chloroplastic isoform X2 [Hordeum vulgare subsp. vulgare]|uniref:dihydrodipicolinate reductase-like protein CRR1, chloroplastic isoform X2 n=1 Tax=Hordeum vulgare subsp. vulgare TaxID=112509 RepID=UPI001D1A50AD|nr:dihydrodipicolinate reductase-like protein CRR1, chloroplastic isoform X2 [Hordeum vulgare subsp. vulgare]